MACRRGLMELGEAAVDRDNSLSFRLRMSENCANSLLPRRLLLAVPFSFRIPEIAMVDEEAGDS